MTESTPRLLLLSELFPPAVGGSAVLFRNLYSRLGCPIQVLTNGRSGSPAGFEYVPDVTIDGTCRGLVGDTRAWTSLARGAAPPCARPCGRALRTGPA